MTGRKKHPEWSNVDIVKPTRHSLRLLRSINGFETLAWSKRCYLETSEKYFTSMVPRNLVRFELTNLIGVLFFPLFVTLLSSHSKTYTSLYTFLHFAYAANKPESVKS